MSQAARNIQFKVGGAISRFSILEMKMQEFIVQHYVSNEAMAANFHNQVFDNSLFSFELKSRIFKKIIKEDYPKIDARFPYNKISKAQEYRNIMAHGRLGAKTSDDFNIPDKLYFEHGGKQHPAIELIKNFFLCCDTALESILQLPGVSSENIIG